MYIFILFVEVWIDLILKKLFEMKIQFFVLFFIFMFNIKTIFDYSIRDVDDSGE